MFICKLLALCTTFVSSHMTMSNPDPSQPASVLTGAGLSQYRLRVVCPLDFSRQPEEHVPFFQGPQLPGVDGTVTEIDFDTQSPP